MSPFELEDALNDPSTVGKMPIELPLAHLTAWRWLSKILDVGELEPRMCKVLGQKLLYLSYGAVHYRTGRIQTEDATELPVAVVVGPEVLAAADCFYPFDSGAIADGRFDPKWNLVPFEDKFVVRPAHVPTPAPKLVQALYGTNAHYVDGNPSPISSTYPEPLPSLYRFLNHDMSSSGIDHRHRTIEEVTSNSIKLGQHLQWIGFPQIHNAEVCEKLYRWTKPRLPLMYAYRCTRNFNPAEIARELEVKAHEAIIRSYVEFQG